MLYEISETDGIRFFKMERHPYIHVGACHEDIIMTFHFFVRRERRLDYFVESEELLLSLSATGYPSHSVSP